MTEQDTQTVKTADLRALRDALSDLFLNARSGLPDNCSEVPTELLRDAIAASSAIIPLGVWEDRSAPFVWLDE